MFRLSSSLLIVVAFSLFGSTPCFSQEYNTWHQWRGPATNGTLNTPFPPTRWSENKNIKWKVPIEGRGNSTPIVTEKKVFLLSAIKTDRVDPDLLKPSEQPKANFFDIKKPNAFYQFVVLCLDRESGQEMWRKTAKELVPHEGVHHDNKFVSASPVTDGERLYCWFGSAGLFCFDLNGNQLWSRDFGEASVESSLGEGASPVIHDGKLVLLRDTSSKPMIRCLDTMTGETIWEKERDEKNTWATPLIVDRENKVPQVVTTGSNFVRSYDLRNGEILWQCSGLTGNCIPTPIVKENVVFCMSGYKGFSLLAIDVDQRGDISESGKVRFRKQKGTPYIPSPVLVNGLLYFVQSNSNILTIIRASTGKEVVERTRIPGLGNIYSSPIATGLGVYFTDRNGKTVVLRHGSRVKIMATNTLDEKVDASLAAAGNQIFIRGEKSLYCISNE